MQASLYDFGNLSFLHNRSPLLVDLESSVIFVSSDIFSGSSMDAYIEKSGETVVREGVDLTCDIDAKCVPVELPHLA